MSKKLEISAKDARQKTLKEQENRTWEAIKAAVHAGSHEVSLDFGVNDDLKSKLIRLGYKFNYSPVKSRYMITWGEQVS